MKKSLFLIGILLIGLGVLTACAAPAEEAPVVLEVPTEVPVIEEPTPEPTALPELTGDPLRGGMLYYDWMAGTGADVPPADQTLWATQFTNARSGKDSWRCKECHGWDFKGVDGAYGSGSHATGFAGVLQVSGSDPYDVLASLNGTKNADHDFSAVMDEQALTDIALFLSIEMDDTAAFIDGDKLAIGGDLDSGKTIFEANCAECHGVDGTALNFGSFEEPVFVGPKSLDNPWEVVHKSRYGLAKNMPAMAEVTNETQDYIDLLAYIQTLPAVAPSTSVGGRMYDNWIKVIGAETPAEDQPLWATQDTNTRTGKDTWRCKECHGWDYKGAEGAYASGSHFTGFVGVTGVKEMSAEEVQAALSAENHDFSAFWTSDQMDAMVGFLLQTQDVASFVNEDKTVTGDLENGQELYTSSCEICHGVDGTELDFDDGEGTEFVGTLAVGNPWEIFNKIAHGQPAEPDMPSGLGLGWSIQDIVDVLAYLQTLPVE